MTARHRDLKYLAALGGAGMLAAAVFLTLPQIDLGVARLFADGTNGFPRAHSDVLNMIDRFIKVFSYAAPSLIFIGLVLAFLGRSPLPVVRLRDYAFLLLTFFLGPILTVNLVLKEYWGRARPIEIGEFGGSAEFTPALLIADQCAANCSFVSGDASFAFWTVAVALVLPGRRPLYVTAALIFGALIGLNRMVQGAHFLSDVIFAAVFTLMIIVILKMLMLNRADGAAHITRG